MSITFADLITKHQNNPKVFYIIYYISKKVKNISDYYQYRKEQIDFTIEYFEEILTKISNGTPIERVVGFTYFQNQKFLVFKGVFIPRFETECVANALTKEIKKTGKNYCKYVDICSGTGVIGISVFNSNRQQISSLTCVDISKEACDNIKENFLLFSLKEKVTCDDWKNVLKDEKAEIISANFPYISETEEYDKLILEHEPHLALFASKDGWEQYEKLLEFMENDLCWRIIACECNEFHKDKWLKIQKEKTNYHFQFIDDHNNKFRGVIIVKE